MARQLARLREALDGGMPRRGWKVGINVPEVLRRLELPHPGVGWLDGRRVFASGVEIDVPTRARLHVEPELALRLARDISPGASPRSVRGAIAALHPALELVDYARPTSGLDDVVAHCMFHDGVVLGSEASVELPDDLGRRWPILHAGAGPVPPPRTDLVPRDLGDLLCFVADSLAAFGQELRAGDLVLTGSYTAEASPLVAGGEVRAEFGPLGAVSVRAAARG